MGVDAKTLRKLAALSLSGEQMAGVLDVLADNAEAEEARKEAQRERTRKARAKQRNATDTLQSRDSHSDDTRGGMTRVEDKSQTTEIEPQEQNKAPASPSPRQLLETVLDAERAAAVLDHRKRIKVPLGQRAAQLLANELAKCPDPNEAADLMVLRGWRGFEAKWLTEPNSRAGPAPKPQTAQEIARDLLRSMGPEDANTTTQTQGNYPALVGLPGPERARSG